MTQSLLLEAVQSYEDDNGKPLNGGKLYTYSAGTLTPKATYQDAAGATPNANPVILNARGEGTVYGTGNYRFILKDSADVTIYDRDNIATTPTAADLSGADGASHIGYDDTTLDVFLKSRLSRVVDSIAALRSLDKTKYTHAYVTGYYSAGSGGGGAYWYDSSDTTTADNSGTIIVATDGGRWKLVKPTYLTPDHFGAKGDGATDDLTACNSLVAYLASIGGGLFFVPAKSYLLSNELVISTATIEFRGEDRHKSRLIFGASAVNGLRFALNSTGGGSDYECANVYNLTLLTKNASTSGSAPGKCAIKYVPTAGQQGSPYPTVSISGVEIRGENAFNDFWQTGMHLENAVNAMVNDVVVAGKFNYQDMYYGLITDKFAVNVQVTNCVFNYMATGITMISTESVAPPGFVLGCEGLQVIGCQFGGVQYGVIKDNGTSVDPRPLTLITGCHINATQHCVYVSNCTETVISGNLFYIQDTINYTVAAGASCVRMANPNSSVVNRHAISGTLMRTLAAQTQVRGIVSDVGFTTIGECVFQGFDLGIILSANSNTNSVANCGFINISSFQIQNAGSGNWYSAKTPMAAASSFDIF
jgi:hypothetical protein